jgi:DNA-binding beta-propeller fold protein YncE
MEVRTMTRTTALAPLVALLLPLLAGCPQDATQPDAGPTDHRWFWSPQGISVTDTYVLVANTGLYMQGAESRYGRGFVTVIDRKTRRPVGRIDTSMPNTSEVAVQGQRAYVLNSGGLAVSGGLAQPTTGGSIDVLDLAAGVPTKLTRTIKLGLSAADPRIGSYGSLVLDTAGKTAYLGSGTRGDAFSVDLQAGKVLRGPDAPIVLFPTKAGDNGMTVVRPWGAGLALLSFNTEELCLSQDLAGGLAQRTCHAIKAQQNLLSGPVDLARAPDGSALIVMTLANAIHKADLSASPFALKGKLASTGLAANRVLVHDGAAYVLNSLSANLQRVDLTTGKSALPFAVLPTGSNPYDMAITKEGGQEIAWVTLLRHHAVALVDLATGKVVGLIRDEAGADGGTDLGAADAEAADNGVAAPIVGASSAVTQSYGQGAGSGQAQMPKVIQGGPQGTGGAGGSKDVLSLGVGGEIVLEFGAYDVVDGPGPDFIVFENPFLLGPFNSFAEPGVVGVAAAGHKPTDFSDFPCDLTVTAGDPVKKTWAYPGCAGVQPVQANVLDNKVPPTDPAQAGGDPFDLATIGLKQARYIRIKDAGVSALGTDSKGFDLDAVVLIHYKIR